MRASEDIASALEAHGNAVWRACALYFRSSPDAEDAYQETFLKYALAEDARFNDEEHRKAWLVRVATNVCKDMLRRQHDAPRSTKARSTTARPHPTPSVSPHRSRATWWTSCARFPTLPAPRSICPCTKGIPLPR